MKIEMFFEYLSTIEPYEPHYYIHVENEKGDEKRGIRNY